MDEEPIWVREDSIPAGRGSEVLAEEDSAAAVVSVAVVVSAVVVEVLAVAVRAEAGDRRYEM